MKDSLKALIFHRNRGVILGFEFLFGVGVPLLAVMTLLPGFFRHLGVAHVWIGVLPALQTTCIALMHVVSTYLIPADEKRLSRVRAIYALSGIAFVLLGVLILNGLHAPAPTLIATLLTVTVFALAIGSSDPHYLDFVVAAIDPAQRGRYFGMRFMAFGLGRNRGRRFGRASTPRFSRAA